MLRLRGNKNRLHPPRPVVLVQDVLVAKLDKYSEDDLFTDELQKPHGLFRSRSFLRRGECGVWKYLIQYVARHPPHQVLLKLAEPPPFSHVANVTRRIGRATGRTMTQETANDPRSCCSQAADNCFYSGLPFRR